MRLDNNSNDRLLSVMEGEVGGGSVEVHVQYSAAPSLAIALEQLHFTHTTVGDGAWVGVIH